MYISSVNTWTSRDSPLTQLIKELDLCLFLRVIQSSEVESQQTHIQPINILLR